MPVEKTISSAPDRRAPAARQPAGGLGVRGDGRNPALEKPAVKKPAAKRGQSGESAKAGKPSGAAAKAQPDRPETIRPKTARPAPPRRKAGAPKPADPAVVHEIFSRLRRANPEPRGELEHVNVYTLLVAVVLSAQATDSGVNRATRALFAVADTPEKMLALGEERVRDHIKTIGLFRAKAKNVIALSEQLIRDHGGEVPASRELLETLPGVGRKTANVVLNMAFGAETMAVDTHVFRIANRLRLAPGKTPLDVERGLEKAVPKEFRLHAHHWLILHGRYVCKAIRPACEVCVLADLCASADKRI